MANEIADMPRRQETDESRHACRPIDGQAHRTVCALTNVAGELLQIELERLARDVQGAGPITPEDVYRVWFETVAPSLTKRAALKGVVERYLEALSDAS